MSGANPTEPRFSSERIATAGPLQAIEEYSRRGWTDGLPIIPPTPERVAQFLEVARLAPGEVLGSIPTRDVAVDAESVAINAVMAGCLPEYMPVVVAAIRAQLSADYNVHANSGTLSGAADVCVVNGPIRTELGFNCKDGVFGPGFRPNASIARAIRLVTRNVYHSVPQLGLDRATFSQPARFSGLCFGENEEESPWKPLHVQRGFSARESALTLFSVMDIVKATPVQASSAGEIVSCLAYKTRASWYYAGQSSFDEKRCLLIVIGGYHMRIFAEENWDKERIQSELADQLRAPGTEHERPMQFARPDCILLVAAGGVGMPQSWIFMPFPSHAAQTRRIEPG